MKIHSSLSLRSKKKQLIETFIKWVKSSLIEIGDNLDLEVIFNKQFLEPQRREAIFDLAKEYDWNENQLSSLLNQFWINNSFDQLDINLVEFLKAQKVGFFSNWSKWKQEEKKRLNAIKNCYEKCSGFKN